MPDPILTLYVGAYQQELLQVIDEDAHEAVDLTGCVVTVGIWHRLEDPMPAIPLKVTGGDVVHAAQTGVTLGQATVTFRPEDTVPLLGEPLLPGPYWLVVWVRDALLNPKLAIPPTRIPIRPAPPPAP